VALALYAFIVLFYVAMPILREDRSWTAGSGQAGSGLGALGDARAAESHGGDFGEDT
jgi:hypothetical protein